MLSPPLFLGDDTKRKSEEEDAEDGGGKRKKEPMPKQSKRLGNGPTLFLPPKVVHKAKKEGSELFNRR